MPSGRLFLLGLILLIVGFLIILAGSMGSGSSSFGGVIFIGPIPIVFGSGPGGGLIALISLVSAAVMILLLYLQARARRN